MISHKTVQFDQDRVWNAVNIEIDGFGFLKGGYLSFNISSTNAKAVNDAKLVFAVIRADIWNLLSAAKWDTASKYAPFFCELPSFARFPIASSQQQQQDWLANYNNNNNNNSNVTSNMNDDDLNDAMKSIMIDSFYQQQEKDDDERQVNSNKMRLRRRVFHSNNAHSFSVQYDFDVTETDHYAFLLLKCEPNSPSTFSVEMDMMTLNPNNQHLSTQTVPLVLVYYVLAVLYGALTLYWIGLSVYNVKSFTRLHLLITFCFVAQMAAMIAAYAYYQILSKQGQLSSTLEITLEIVSAVGDTFFLLILLLVAMGWTMIESMGIRRVQNTFSLAFFLYFLFRVLYAFCRQPSLCPAYVLSYRIIKLMLIFGIIMSINQSIERLRIASLEQQFSGDTGEVFIKMKMLKTFRTSYYLFLAAPIFTFLLQYALVSWVNYWVLVATEQLINYFMMWIICTTFYPKKYTLADSDEMVPPSGI